MAERIMRHQGGATVEEVRPALDASANRVVDDAYQRHVSAHIELEVATPADMVFAIAVANEASCVHESLEISSRGRPLPLEPFALCPGGRFHRLRDVAVGHVSVDYRATVVETTSLNSATDADTYRYLVPSRFCESDRLGPLARSQFAGLHEHDLLAAVSSWVGTHVDYVPSSSRPTDGAVSTLLARSGVCRDFAHLTVALLRANGMPARTVSAYAPGLDPMDFHSVVEAYVGSAWFVVDPTCLAPRQSLVRIATGVDAADTAFLTVVTGAVELVGLNVGAIASPALPTDDSAELVQLG